jgi:glycosyltransferase involved in cell wall biosynthesis
VTDRPLRVLVLGFLNSPHVTAWCDLVAGAGHDVFLAGRSAPQFPPAVPSERTFDVAVNGPVFLRGRRLSSAIGSVAADLDPDIVHAHWLSEFGWIAAREEMHPLVCSAWGTDVIQAPWIGRRRSRVALRAACHVFADSTHLANETQQLAGRQLSIEVLRWGLDLERFSPGDFRNARVNLGLPSEGRLVTCVRGFGSTYNTDLVLESFQLLRLKLPGARLLLKYPGTTVPERVTTEIQRRALDDSVILMGNLPEDRMPDLYRASDVVVSIPSSDSSPRSVWEAFGCGRPVVVSDLPWARDELNPGEHALLVELDGRAVSNALERILDDPALAASLGAAARALARAELDPAVSTARVDQVYRELAESM